MIFLIAAVLIIVIFILGTVGGYFSVRERNRKHQELINSLNMRKEHNPVAEESFANENTQ